MALEIKTDEKAEGEAFSQANSDKNKLQRLFVHKRLSPDLQYLRKILSRQWLVSIICGMAVFALALPLIILSRDPYSSEFVVSEDSRGASNPVERRIANTTAEIFALRGLFRFGSPEFLLRLAIEADRLPETKIDMRPFADSILKAKNALFSKLRNAGFMGEPVDIGSLDPDQIPVDSELGSKLVADMSSKLRVVPERAGNSIRATLDGRSPQGAMAAAKLSLDMFMKSELNAEIERADYSISFLAVEVQRAEKMLKKTKQERAQLESLQIGSFGEKATVVDRNPASIGSLLSPPAEKVSPPNAPNLETTKALGLREKEAEIQNQIVNRESELTLLGNNRLQERLKLESELKTLESRFNRDHPEVVGKLTEIQTQSNQTEKENAISAELRELRKTLWQVKGDISSSPNALKISELLLDESRQERNLLDLSQRLSDLNLEKQNLRRQLEDPSSRTLYKVLQKPSFSSDPSKSNRLKILLAAVAASIASMFGIAILRELLNPIAKDGWRIQLAVNAPVLAQISFSSMRSIPRIGLRLSDELRSSLRKKGKQDRIKSKTLLAYRRLELSVRRNSVGRTILLTNAGEDDKLSGFLYSFINIIASDTQGKVIVIDCNHIDPILQTNSSNLDLAEQLDSIDGESLVQAYRNEDCGFDYIPPSPEIVGAKTRLFTDEKFSKLFERLAKNYDYIFVRSFPESHFIENTALVNASSDSVLIVDAKRTEYSEISRTLVHLDSGKIRGLVLVGT